MDADLPLIEAIRAGDETALEALMQRHQQALFYFVLRYLRNESAARDVVQETFIRTFFKAASFHPRSTVKTWVFTIALNLCRDAGRKLRRSPGFVSLDEPSAEGRPSLDLPDDRARADEVAAGNEDAERLRDAIDRLPEKLRVPLVFCTLEQHSHQEAADLLGTTPKTIELRIYRAKKKLRALMSKSRNPGN